MDFLDAITIPYQVVLRDKGGVYINQYPQSFFVCKGAVCFIASGVGGGSHILKKDFSEIDWDSCQPSTSAYNMTTNEGRMSYLSTIFTGQQGTPVSSTLQPQSFYTTPILSAEVRSGVLAYLPFSCGSGVLENDFSKVVSMGIKSNVAEISVTIVENSLDESSTLSFFYNNGDNACILSIPPNATGVFYVDLSIAPPSIIKDSYQYYLIEGASSSGTISISSIRTTLMPIA